MTHVFHGCDVSHHQTDPPKPATFNWSATVRLGAMFGACKVTEGASFIDPAWQANRAGMKAAGLRYRGLYVWIKPTASAAAHVALFKHLVGNLNSGEFVMLDIEEHPLTDAQIVAALEAFEAAYPGRVVRYQGLYFPFGTEGDSPLFARWPWIIACYTATLPAAMTEAPVIWQWAGGAGGVVIDGYRVDSNTVLDFAEMDRVCNLGTPPQPPREDDVQHFVVDEFNTVYLNEVDWQGNEFCGSTADLGIDWRGWNLQGLPPIEHAVAQEKRAKQMRPTPAPSTTYVGPPPFEYGMLAGLVTEWIAKNLAVPTIDPAAIGAAVVEAIRAYESRP